MTHPRVGLIYESDAFVETLTVRTPEPDSQRASGLMGRQVAGKQFLDAYLRYGGWRDLHAITSSNQAADELLRYCQQHPSSRERKRALFTHDARQLGERFFPTSPVDVIHYPNPPDNRVAWLRHSRRRWNYSITGVTHTMCSLSAVAWVCDLLTVPFEECDALIVTSQAVRDMIDRIHEDYGQYLKERTGGQPRSRMRLETIPLGVEPTIFHPPDEDARQRQRRRLQIADDEFVVLFVGRLSHHAKSHPFPLFESVQRAAERTGQRIRLLMCGWAANPAIMRAFMDGARKICPNVRVDFLDGTDASLRFTVWHAADVFASLVDNIQETFGLVILEAMACGLPVLATDWNGYRDLVQHEESGLLIPTWGVEGAAETITERLMTGTVNYEHFLSEVSQTVGVDTERATVELVRLIQSPDLRVRLGQNARNRVLAQFTWQRVIQAYEQLWSELNTTREHLIRSQPQPARTSQPPRYPAIPRSFATYPTSWITDGTRIQKTDVYSERLEQLLALPLFTHESQRRINDPRQLQEVLNRADGETTVADLLQVLSTSAVDEEIARNTLAWLLKYNLLRPLS